VGDVIDRVASLGSRAAYTKRFLRDKRVDHQAYIEKHGIDMPEIRNWKWNAASAGQRA
jgi:xylulose-5-phosphate/fructose-6-phosphate phosphoketolase